MAKKKRIKMASSAEEHFPDEYIDQVQKTFDIVKKQPDMLPEFSDFILPESALQDAKGNLPATDDDKLKRFVEIYIATTREVYLGATHWDDMRTHRGQLQCRRCYHKAYARYSHPSLEDIWGDVLECTKVAVAAAGLVAIIADPVAALPAFKLAFFTCLEQKGIGWAESISVSLYTISGDCGHWHGCG